MEQVENRPKWLQDLENRKRKPRLAHEAGAGSPCLICTSACPGLDLHFWRKICKNCKCARDDHDVGDDEFPQFDILLGPSGKLKNRSVFLPVKKQNQDEIPFEWIPPDTSKELAADYMKALPDDKLPIKGSAGAAFRRQQLQKQLPLHDIDHQACDALSEQERTQFEEYLQNLKNYVGQGKVIKSLGARPFSKSLMTPANATDVQQFSPQHKAAVSSGLNLRTPSSFISKNPSASELEDNPPPLPLTDPPNISHNFKPSNLESLRTQMLESSVEKSPQGRYHRALINIPNDTNLTKSEPVEVLNISQKSKEFSPFLRNHHRSLEPGLTANIEPTGRVDHLLEESQELPQDLAEKMLSEALMPPSAIHASEILGSTLDEKELMFIRDKLNSMTCSKEDFERRGPFKSREIGGKYEDANREIEKLINSRQQFSTCKSEQQSQNPQIPGLLSHGKLPGHEIVRDSLTNSQQSFSSDQKLPSGSLIHSNQNLNSDLVHAYVPNIEPLQAELSSYGSVASNVINSEQLNYPVFPEEAVGETPRNIADFDQLEELENANIVRTRQNCHKCQVEINFGDVVVTAEKAKNEVWHPGCFVCTVCNELLADLVYFFYKGQLYCGRDLATLLNIQRCFACDELIFTSTYTVAEGHNYHVKHFCCWDCDEPLAGKQYTSENDRPLCLPCYQNTYAKICSTCNQAIAANQQGVAIKNLDFHVDEKCFCCFTCKRSLLNGKVGIKENKPFCSKECISQFQSQK